LKIFPNFIRKFFRNRIAQVVFSLIIVLLLLAGFKTLQIRKMTGPGARRMIPAQTVTSADAREVDWQPILSAVGSISPVQGATISAEVPGTVAEIAFESGASVKKGDLLVRIDAPVEEALMRAAEAEAKLAQADLERARDLARRKVIAPSELDTTEAKYKQKVATLDNMRSLTDKKTIRAPFDGAAGIREVNIGQMVIVGQHIVSLQTLDPVFADFSLPQQRLSELAPGLEVRVRTDAYPDREFKGKLTAINSSIDVATRSLPLQATLENPERLLKSGMFAKIQVLLPATNPALVIPVTAISYAPYGDSVYVIEKKKDEKSGEEITAIRQQFVRLGEARGDLVAVMAGLKAGDKVVSTGVFKLTNGMAVQIDNTLAPKPQESPKPENT
jgi:membrane fusion protein (multidrug efflux system)